jgi:hypothetical protein
MSCPFGRRRVTQPCGAACCDLRQKIAQDAAAWRKGDDSAFVVRSKIDAKYRALGPPTSTPLVFP